MGIFGNAKFGGKRNWFKIKDGDNVFRIFPPMGDLQEEGRWSMFYRIHYGYRNSEKQMRTFQSPLIQDRKTKEIKVRDAALERIQLLTEKLEEARKTGKQDVVQQLLKLVGGQKSQYNLDSNHYLNVIDLQGNIGILKIRHKCKLALDQAIDKLRKEGVEPLNPDTGRFFVFTRSGTGRDTTYSVSVYKQKLRVEGVGDVEKDYIHQITPDIESRCAYINKDGTLVFKEAANLATLFKKPTAEEVLRIVKEGESAVDAILDAKTATGGDSGEDDSGSEDDDTTTQTAQATTGTGGTTQTTTPATTTTTATALTLTPTTTVITTTTPTPATTASATTPSGTPLTTAEAISQMSPEDFLKSLNLGA